MTATQLKKVTGVVDSLIATYGETSPDLAAALAALADMLAPAPTAAPRRRAAAPLFDAYAPRRIVGADSTAATLPLPQLRAFAAALRPHVGGNGHVRIGADAPVWVWFEFDGIAAKVRMTAYAGDVSIMAECRYTLGAGAPARGFGLRAGDLFAVLKLFKKNAAVAVLLTDGNGGDGAPGGIIVCVGEDGTRARYDVRPGDEAPAPLAREEETALLYIGDAAAVAALAARYGTMRPGGYAWAVERFPARFDVEDGRRKLILTDGVSMAVADLGPCDAAATANIPQTVMDSLFAVAPSFVVGGAVKLTTATYQDDSPAMGSIVATFDAPGMWLRIVDGVAPPSSVDRWRQIHHGKSVSFTVYCKPLIAALKELATVAKNARNNMVKLHLNGADSRLCMVADIGEGQRRERSIPVAVIDEGAHAHEELAVDCKRFTAALEAVTSDDAAITYGADIIPMKVAGDDRDHVLVMPVNLPAPRQ